MPTVSVRYIVNDVDDPSGNPVELFEPSIAEARLAGGGT
jgi:hypothetical protein